MPAAAAEMVGIDFQRLAAIVDRLLEMAQAKLGDRPLVPNLGQPRRLADQGRGIAQGDGEFVRPIQHHQAGQLLPLGRRADPHQTERIAVSAISRTPRSASLSARPRTGLDS